MSHATDSGLSGGRGVTAHLLALSLSTLQVVHAGYRFDLSNPCPLIPSSLGVVSERDRTGTLRRLAGARANEAFDEHEHLAETERLVQHGRRLDLATPGRS